MIKLPIGSSVGVVFVQESSLGVLKAINTVFNRHSSCDSLDNSNRRLRPIELRVWCGSTSNNCCTQSTQVHPCPPPRLSLDRSNSKSHNTIYSYTELCTNHRSTLVRRWAASPCVISRLLRQPQIGLDKTKYCNSDEFLEAIHFKLVISRGS